jgi:FHS family L-fucose permease-like MFS transporter
MKNDTSATGGTVKLVTPGFLIPFILITSLFFLWGVAHGMLDTLNKHFQGMLKL